MILLCIQEFQKIMVAFSANKITGSQEDPSTKQEENHL